jgi:hypothetical protein
LFHKIHAGLFLVENKHLSKYTKLGKTDCYIYSTTSYRLHWLGFSLQTIKCSYLKFYGPLSPKIFKACQELGGKNFSLYLDSLELMWCIVQHVLQSAESRGKGAQTI